MLPSWIFLNEVPEQNYQSKMNREQDPDEYWFDWSMGINEIRIFHDHLCYAIQTWPGSPARPPEEQEFLKFMKQKTFAMLLEYQLDQPSAENDF